jgi:hypothetical protein
MSNELLLDGLDGANPLAFLAALGTLRTLQRIDAASEPRMCWRIERGAWRPVLRTANALHAATLPALLDESLKKMKGNGAWSVGSNLNVSPEAFRAYATEAASTANPADFVHAEFAAAFASEAASETAAGKEPIVSDTALRTMSGAGHQHFIGFMQQLVELTNADHIGKALFSPWAYDDEKPSLRWDPEDDRRYALRWNEPSSDPIKTVRGANRLAIEALPLMPVMPRSRKLETTGFVTAGSKGTYWTWPLWEFAIGLDVVRSLLADRRLYPDSQDLPALNRIGVCALYRSQRLTVGKYRNFTPGICV